MYEYFSSSEIFLPIQVIWDTVNSLNTSHICYTLAGDSERFICPKYLRASISRPSDAPVQRMVGPTAFAQTASGISYKVRNDAWNGVTALLVGGKRITDVSDDKATGLHLFLIL